MTDAKKPKSKTEVLQALADASGLSRKDVANVFTQLSTLIGKEIDEAGDVVVVGMGENGTVEMTAGGGNPGKNRLEMVGVNRSGPAVDQHVVRPVGLAVDQKEAVTKHGLHDVKFEHGVLLLS
mgnify:CR=1 FL=1